MNDNLLESNILKLNNELNDLFFIPTSLYSNGFIFLTYFMFLMLFIGAMMLYQNHHHETIKNLYDIDEKYINKIKNLEKMYSIIAGIFMIGMLTFGAFIVLFLLTFEKYDEKIEKYVTENKEELTEMFTTSNSYEITDIMTGNTYNNNYFITYKNDDILGQLLTSSETKIKKSDENKITFYETKDTIRKINEMNNKGIKLNKELLNVIKDYLPYYEIEATSIN